MSTQDQVPASFDWYRNRVAATADTRRLLWNLHDQIYGSLTTGQAAGPNVRIAVPLKHELGDGYVSKIRQILEMSAPELGEALPASVTHVVDAVETVVDVLDVDGKALGRMTYDACRPIYSLLAQLRTAAAALETIERERRVPRQPLRTGVIYGVPPAG